MTADVLFLLDVDNTLLDNDRIIADLRAHLEAQFGALSAARYWALFEELRSQLGYADYLGALQRYRQDAEGAAPHEQRLLMMSSFLIDYPFAQCLFPRALEVIAHLSRFGPTIIFSDGDVVFQPRKIQQSGLWDAVEGRVLIYIHKEHMLDSLQRYWPARRYVVVDDKLRILSAMKSALGPKLTTVFPRQGHYALDPIAVANYPPADCSIDRIGDLADRTLEDIVSAGK